MTVNGTSSIQPPFLVRRLKDLPGQPLSDGLSSVRDIWSDAPVGGELRWLLQLVEIRGTGTRLHMPLETKQLIVGYSGPQVTVGARRGHPLRRGRPLTRESAVLEFRRPMLRLSASSRLLSLAYQPGPVVPAYTFDDLHGVIDVAPDTRVLVVLTGEVDYGGKRLDAGTALVLSEPAVLKAEARGARVIALRVTHEDG